MTSEPPTSESPRPDSDTPFVASTSFRVRYAETDAMGVVHHASYIVYFEQGRSHYTRERGSSYADFERSGFYLAVSELETRYISAARYDDLLTVECWCETARSRIVGFAYRILNAETGTLHVTGRTRHICIDRDGNVRRIPPSWLDLLAPHMP